MTVKLKLLGHVNRQTQEPIKKIKKKLIRIFIYNISRIV
jgi:hypothetical protein